MKNCMA